MTKNEFIKAAAKYNITCRYSGHTRYKPTPKMHLSGKQEDIVKFIASTNTKDLKFEIAVYDRKLSLETF